MVQDKEVGNWDQKVYASLVSSLEKKSAKAIELLKLRSDVATVKEATDLLQTELNHFNFVVNNWEIKKKSAVRGQKLLQFRIIGKTKKSKSQKLKKFSQPKIHMFFEAEKAKKKQVRRKLTISSDESDFQDKVLALGDPVVETVVETQARQGDELAGIAPVSDSPLTSDSEMESPVDLNEVLN